ncbi:MAG: hypothetical protein WDN25_07360 [Acetobacteraceae bacterium]
MDAGELGREVDLAEVHKLDRGVDLHAQLGDAAVDEAAKLLDLLADAGTHDVFDTGGHGTIKRHAA